jgi:hypothetical protein
MPKFKQLEVRVSNPLPTSTFSLPHGVTAIVGRMAAVRQRGRCCPLGAGRTAHDGDPRPQRRRHDFAGGKKRARAGMARAAITFDNHDGWLPVDFAEVTIERRTYRDGKTDYLLNGAKSA